MANSDIIKIGFDYRASLAQFEKDTNGVFDGISDKAGKQKITIQLDAKDDKVIDKIKELQKLKLDKFTFEFGDSGLKEQLQTFDKLKNKINEIINLSKRIDLSFDTKNKTEAFNQLKKYADAFKSYYGNEEVMATNAGAKAGYAYYKAYEEALRKGVAQSKLEKVTIDFDVNSSTYTKEGFVERRIEEFKKFQKYGDADESTLIGEIAILENRLLKFNSAYSQVKANLGDAPITPEITKNIEEYVSWLEIAESRAKDAELFGGYSSEDFNSDKDFANMYLGFAKEGAIAENKKYIESLKQEETQAVATAEAEQKLAEAQKETVSNTSNSNDSQIEELKSDITEVKTELGDVKDKISSIESNGFENVREDVEKTKESVKELNSELIEMKSNFSSTPQESNISSENIIGSQAKENTQALNDEINSVNSLISAFRKLYETNKKSYKGGESLLVGNFDGSTLSHMGADFSSIKTDVIDGTIKAFKDTTNQVVSFLAHTHPSDVAAFSTGDIYNAFFDYINNQIKNYFIIAKKEISWFDTSSLDGIDHEEFLEKFKDNKERILQDIQEETQVWGNFSKYLTNIFDGDLYGGLTKLVKDSIDNSIANLGEHKIPEDVLNSLYIGLEEKVRKYIDSINDNDFVSASTVINTLRRNIGSGLEEYSMSKPAFANGGASRLDSTMWKNLYDELKSVFDTANQQNENIQNGIKQALIETLSSYGINADDVYKSMSFDDFSKAIVDGNLSATQSAREAIEVFKQEAQTVENISSETPIKDVSSNISSVNPTVEVSQNDEVTASIRKKKEELASYELQLEETRYEIEKLSKAENEANNDNLSKKFNIGLNAFDSDGNLNKNPQIPFSGENISDLNQTNELLSSEVSTTQQQEKIQNQVTQSIKEQNEAIDESIKKTLTLNDVRQKQWEIIQKTNPKEEGTNSTWIDNPEDVKTFYEVNHKDSDYPFNENYSDDWTVKDKMNVEATGKITVYSSYPIEDGNWVTPSKEEGLSYAGSGKLYSATIDPRDIAWVDAGQGQVAHISDELKEVIDLSTKAETQVQSIDNKTNETDNQSTLNTLDDTIAKYETIVALVKEYYDLSNNKKDTIGMSSDNDERISEIRKQLKSYTQNPDYDGEYKMGFGGSGKNIFAKSVDLSQEEMLQEICNMLGVEIPKNADKAKEAIKEVATATNSTEPTKDAFPDSSTDTKPETEGMEQVEKATEEAANAKKEFATANEGVQSSIDGSENPLKLEAELMEQIAKSAREAANAKKEFVEANKQVKDSADGSNNDLTDGHSENAEPSGVKKYKKKGYKAHDTGNHDNEKKVSNKAELGKALKDLQSEIIASIDESTSFIKEVTDFYDSQDNLVKTQMKVGDKNGSMRTYTTSYSMDKDGNATAWTSHID